MYGALPPMAQDAAEFALASQLPGTEHRGTKHTYPVGLHKGDVQNINFLLGTPLFEIYTCKFFGRHMKQLAISARSEDDEDVPVQRGAAPSLVNESEAQLWQDQITDTARMWLLGFGFVPYRLVRRGSVLVPVVCNMREITSGNSWVFVGLDLTKTPVEYEFYWAGRYTKKRDMKEHPAQPQFKYDASVFFFRSRVRYLPDDRGVLHSILSKFAHKLERLHGFEMMELMREREKLDHHGFIEVVPPKSSEEVDYLKHLRTIRYEKVRVQDDERFGPIEEAEGYQPFVEVPDGSYGVTTAYDEDHSGRLTRLGPNEKFRPRAIAKGERDVGDMRSRFERLFAAMLASSQQPWTDQTAHAQTIDEVNERQQFDMMKARDELRLYAALVKEWFVRIHGHEHLQRARQKRGVALVRTIAERARGRGPSARVLRAAHESIRGRRGKTKDAMDPLDDEEVDLVLQGNMLVVKVTFERAIYLTRPNVESLIPFYAAGMIDDRKWASMNSDAYGVDMTETSPKRYLGGILMAEGQLPPTDQMMLELEHERRSAELQLQVAKKMQAIEPPPAPAAGGSSAPAPKPSVPKVSASLSSVTSGLQSSFRSGGGLTKKRKGPIVPDKGRPKKRRKVVGRRKAARESAGKRNRKPV